MSDCFSFSMPGDREAAGAIEGMTDLYGGGPTPPTRGRVVFFRLPEWDWARDGVLECEDGDRLLVRDMNGEVHAITQEDLMPW